MRRAHTSNCMGENNNSQTHNPMDRIYKIYRIESKSGLSLNLVNPVNPVYSSNFTGM